MVGSHAMPAPNASLYVPTKRQKPFPLSRRELDPLDPLDLLMLLELLETLDLLASLDNPLCPILLARQHQVHRVTMIMHVELLASLATCHPGLCKIRR